eukprot:TRINITY_DN7317_c0_g1_i1.p1 TRINITY_DN7317_c0_g1~~TRINITY_DN7317_c0_g1_i1.p1  ORF type:complete len:833 (+),score=294.68 TRINITY_DN7317_c0_g1_i1:120-2501(+)
MDLDIGTFVEAFVTNPAFVRKVSIVTGLTQDALKSLTPEEVREGFAEFDTDCSGTLSYDEFVKGLVRLREANKLCKEEAELADAENMLEVTAQRAAEVWFGEGQAALEALTAADMQTGELDLQAFIEALSDPDIQQKISSATKLPAAFFAPENMSAMAMLNLFKDIDVDGNGTVSFQEWVHALVRIRIDTYNEEKAEKMQEEEALNEVMKHAEEALEHGDEDWSGEFDLGEFVNAFKSNPKFLRKVSLATDVPVDEFKLLQSEDIAELFLALDTDCSGTVSFEEFVKGLVKIRLERQVEKKEQEDAEEEAAMDEAVLDAVDAFQDADFGFNGELDLQQFMEAMSQPHIVEKVASATHISPAWFAALDVNQLVDMFKDIDTDSSGTVSFNEWVTALIKARQTTYQEEKLQQQMLEQEKAAVLKMAEEALDEGDDDWSGEFSLAEFMKAFRVNPRFLRKVSLATDVPVDEYRSLADEDLADLFQALDTDFSGTVSFDEFVKGLVEIRVSRRLEKEEQAAEEEQEAIDNAAMDAIDAFAQADLGLTGELDLQGFVKAMKDTSILEKVSEATKLPVDYFLSMNEDQILEIFQQIDTDGSGTVDFNEWVSALVKTRQATYQQEKLEQAEALDAVLKDAEAAIDEADEDWSGEFELDEFVKAFKTNQKFLIKVAHATGVPAAEYQKLQEADIVDLFTALDTDFSGTVSFKEFVTGLAEIRMANEAGELTIELPAQEVKDVVSRCSAVCGESLKTDDFKKIMMKLDGGKWTDRRIEALIASAPCNADGSISLGTLIDFVF